jgi:diguanylate cyclase (GGDEF)-like protein/PAS domain S-box-containing protein
MLEPFVLLTAVRDESGTIVDFEFTDSNPAAEAVYQMSHDELRGRRLLTLHPAAAGALFDMYVDVVERDKPMVLDDWSYPQDILEGQVLRYDVRAVKVGDSVSQVWRDVTPRYLSAQRLEESEKRFRLLAQSSSDVVLLVRGEAIEWVSPALMPMLGWRGDEWVGHGLLEFIHPADVTLAKASLQAVEAGAKRAVRLRMRDSTHVHHWVDVQAAPSVDDDDAVPGIVALLRTIDGVVEAELALEGRARHDDLTGLLNRAEAISRLRETQTRPASSGRHRAVAFCDIDHFKNVNDSYGHVAGDEALRAVASRISSIVRADDLVARFGGDEVLIVLEGVHGVDDALAIAEKIRVQCHRPIPLLHSSLTVTLSIGVTLADPTETVDSLIARADLAMYEAKGAGRDRVVAL